MSLEDAATGVRAIRRRTGAGDGVHGGARRGDAGLSGAGSVVFDYGNNLRQRAFDYGVKDAFEYPGFVPAYIRPLFCEGRARSAGWRSAATRRTSTSPTGSSSNCSPKMSISARWITLAEERIDCQGLPARICWLELR